MTTKSSKKHKPKPPATQPSLHIWPAMTTARRLDLIADFELSAGHIARAEHFSRLAAEIRGQRS
jgi:hypothetical protein